MAQQAAGSVARGGVALGAWGNPVAAAGFVAPASGPYTVVTYSSYGAAYDYALFFDRTVPAQE